MTVRNALIASAVALGCLFGAGTATAAAAPTPAPTGATLHCGIHYKLTRDLNGRLYCKFSPDPRHRGGNGNSRHAGHN